MVDLDFDHGMIADAAKAPFAAFRVSPNFVCAAGIARAADLSLAVAIVTKSFVENIEGVRVCLEGIIGDEDWAVGRKRGGGQLVEARARIEERSVAFAPPKGPDGGAEWILGIEKLLTDASIPEKQPIEAIPRYSVKSEHITFRLTSYGTVNDWGDKKTITALFYQPFPFSEPPFDWDLHSEIRDRFVKPPPQSKTVTFGDGLPASKDEVKVILPGIEDLAEIPESIPRLLGALKEANLSREEIVAIATAPAPEKFLTPDFGDRRALGQRLAVILERLPGEVLEVVKGFIEGRL
jgi:hypothetical protein